MICKKSFSEPSNVAMESVYTKLLYTCLPLFRNLLIFAQHFLDTLLDKLFPVFIMNSLYIIRHLDRIF